MYGPPLPPISDCQTTETPLTTMEETTMTSEGPETTTEGPEETTTMISCEDFTEGLCPLSEDNILNSTSSTPSVEECQLICRWYRRDNSGFIGWYFLLQGQHWVQLLLPPWLPVFPPRLLWLHGAVFRLYERPAGAEHLAVSDYYGGSRHHWGIWSSLRQHSGFTVRGEEGMIDEKINIL